MITSNKGEKPPVRAVLRVAMIFEGKPREKGEIVAMKARDFVYLSGHDRVAEATEENVDSVKAEVKAERAAAAKAAQTVSDLESTKSQLATALAKIAELEGKK